MDIDSSLRLPLRRCDQVREPVREPTQVNSKGFITAGLRK